MDGGHGSAFPVWLLCKGRGDGEGEGEGEGEAKAEGEARGEGEGEGEDCAPQTGALEQAGSEDTPVNDHRDSGGVAGVTP